jgi:predicted RecA/RadA family phage recombinase
MSNLIEVTDTTKIKPLCGAIVRRYNAGAAVTAGYPVYLDSNGAVRVASGSTAAANRVIGVAVTAIASGGRGDVVVKGPIYCLTGATPGGKLLTLNSAGGMDHTGGTKKTVVGVAETAEILFVRPRMSDLS